MRNTVLSRDEKFQLFKDGFIVIKNVIPKAKVERARQLVEPVLRDNGANGLTNTINDYAATRHAPRQPKLNNHPEILDMYNKSALHDILCDVMGPHSDALSCQIAITLPSSEASTSHLPPLNAHVDGGFAGVIQERRSELKKKRPDPPHVGRRSQPTSAWSQRRCSAVAGRETNFITWLLHCIGRYMFERSDDSRERSVRCASRSTRSS